MFCRFCGTTLPDDSTFCQSCGKSLATNQTSGAAAAPAPALAPTVSATLPSGGGTYHLVFNNQFSLLSPKAVRASIRLHYTL